MKKEKKEKTPAKGKKQARQREIEAKKAEKTAIIEASRKKIYNSRRVAAAFAMFFITAIGLMMMKALHKGPMLQVPEYRQLGNENAITEIYEYTDLACPACAMANEKLHEILEQHGDKIKLTFKHFPLNMHRWASRAALHADCAGEQGKFFDYANMLFENQKDWAQKANEPEEFMLYAEKLGIDKEKFQICLENPDNAERIRLEKAEGDSKGIDGTPSFVINGKYSMGPGELFKEALRLEKMTAEKNANE